jgi:hypothetical protein
LKKRGSKNWKPNLSLSVKGTERSRILRAPLIMIIKVRDNLAMASIRGGAAKRYNEAKNSDLECEGAE